MRFANPEWMWVSASLALALGLFLVWSWHVRKRLVARFVPPRLLALLTVGVSPRRQKLRLWLVFLAAVLLGISLARPQWGFGYKEVKQKGLDIIVAIDTSKSMLAEDLTPNRLTKAKMATLDLRRISHADRIGLIAFAGAAFLQMPMSTDEDVLRQNLDALDTNLLPQGGTAITEAIETANTAFKESGQENHRALILLTDGEDHDGAAIAAAKKAAGAGTVVFTVGVGTTAGELIPVRDAKGRTSYVKDQAGNTVKTRLNEALLREVAKAGNGFYLQLAGAGIMETLYERGLAPLPKREFETSLSKLYFERFQWFLGAALLLLMAEMLVSDRKRATVPATPAAALALALAWMILDPSTVQASASAARKSFDQGQYKNALNEYERLLEKKPENSPLHYNAGSAAFQAGRFESATDHFSAALATGDLSLQQKAYYNRGNSQFRQGEETEDPSKKMELWKKSLNDFETTLKLDPKDVDARQNAELVTRRIEELKQQQQKQDQNQDSDKDKQENKDDKQESKDKKDSKDGSKQENQDGQQDQQKQQQEGNKKENQDGSKDGNQDKPKDSQQKGDDSKQKEEPQQNAPQPQDKDGDGKDSKEGAAGQPPEPKDERDKKGGKAAEQKEGANPPSDNDQDQQQGNPGKVMQMTRRDAIRLLEALRADERLLRPIPPSKTNRTQRAFKDW